MAPNKAAGRLAQITAQHEALARMRDDEDISSEARQLNSRAADSSQFEASASDDYVPLNWKPGAGGHRPNAGTLRLLKQAGGIKALARFTDRFYQRAFGEFEPSAISSRTDTPCRCSRPSHRPVHSGPRRPPRHPIRSMDRREVWRWYTVDQRAEVPISVSVPVARSHSAESS